MKCGGFGRKSWSWMIGLREGRGTIVVTVAEMGIKSCLEAKARGMIQIPLAHQAEAKSRSMIQMPLAHQAKGHMKIMPKKMKA